MTSTSLAPISQVTFRLRSHLQLKFIGRSVVFSFLQLTFTISDRDGFHLSYSLLRRSEHVSCSSSPVYSLFLLYMVQEVCYCRSLWVSFKLLKLDFQYLATPTGPSKTLNMNNFAPERPCHTFEIEEPVTPRARITGPDAFRSVMNTIRLFNDDPRMWFSKCMNKIPQFWHVHKNSHSPEPTWISTDVYYYRSRLPAIPELPEPENDE